MDRITEISTFVKVAELRSFAAAAEALSLSPAMISRYVKSLECRLGVDLLTRSTRHVGMTENGLLFLDHSREILRHLLDAEDAVKDADGKVDGIIRISMPQVLGLHSIIPAIIAFKKTYPTVQFDVRLENERIDLIGDECDLALRVGRLADSSLICRRVGTMQRIICAAPTYLTRHGTPENLSDLQHHECVSYSQLSLEDEWNVRKGKSSLPHWSIRVNSGAALRQAAVEGIGIACLPGWVVRDDLREGRLVRLLPAVKLPEHGVYMISPKRMQPRRLKLFTSCAIPYFRAWLQRE